MRRSRRTVVASLGIALASSSAVADDHLARVHEVLLSHGGDATVQVVEIDDPAVESFPHGGYVLFVYEADGATQAHFQPIVIAPGGTSRITLASDAARTQFGLTLDGSSPNLVINLSGPLPASGSACFRKQGVDLHCLTWGGAMPPASAPLNGQLAGPAPTDGLSLQRQASAECAALGAPTPNAPNATLPCPPPGVPDAGVGADAGTGNMDGDDGGCAVTSPGPGSALVVVAALFAFGRSRQRTRAR